MEKAIKKLGQNFLRNKGIVKKMVGLLDIHSGYKVVEIGPGPGIFTEEIYKNLTETNEFYCVELDQRFVEALTNKYAFNSNVHIIYDDFLEWGRSTILEGETVVLGSIPYYITSPILHTLVKMLNKPLVVVLMVQKEVAEKVAEKKVKPNYLSTFVGTFYDIKYIDTVSRSQFSPVPNVDSAILKMTLKSVSQVIEDIHNYEEFLHGGFKFPKKMLNKVLEKDLLLNCGFTGNERPHDLNVEDWVKLYNAAYEI